MRRSPPLVGIALVVLLGSGCARRAPAPAACLPTEHTVVVQPMPAQATSTTSSTLTWFEATVALPEERQVEVGAQLRSRVQADGHHLDRLRLALLATFGAPAVRNSAEVTALLQGLGNTLDAPDVTGLVGMIRLTLAERRTASTQLSVGRRMLADAQAERQRLQEQLDALKALETGVRPPTQESDDGPSSTEDPGR